MMRYLRKMGVDVIDNIYLAKADRLSARGEAITEEIVKANLVDRVAMDIKNSPELYGKTVGLESFDIKNVERSKNFLLEGRVDYEFRTTVADELHSEASMREMGQWLASLVPGNQVKRLFLQRFVDRDSV